MLPSMSIVTPSFNQAIYLERTLASVAAQGYPGLEHLVMDGGSTDGSVDLLARWADDERRRYRSGPDGGQSAALNQGFRLTTGEIIGWLNSDDLYAPGALVAVGQHFAAHPEVEWLVGRCTIIDRDDRPARRYVTAYKDFWLRRYRYGQLLLENFISQPAVFFRRRLLERVGALDESLHYAMDYDLWLRMGARSEPAVLDRELARFRVSGENKMSTGYVKSFREEYEVARRVAAGRHGVLILLKRLNRWKLVCAYKLMDAAATLRGQRARGA